MKNFLLFQNIEDNQIKKSTLIKTTEYECMGVTTRGLQLLKNEDCLFASQHPNSEDLLMMVVTDGISQGKYGDIAAKTVVDELNTRFCTLSSTYINSPMMLEGKIADVFKHLNHNLHNNQAKASCCVAIKGKKQTLIANIGNTRCYSINDDIVLHTKDDLVWNNYNDWDLITPDGVKYLVGKSYLSKFIGLYPNNKRQYFPNITIIDNDSYNQLILTTHGVTDTLDSKEIECILNRYDLIDALNFLMLEKLYSKPKTTPHKLKEQFQNHNNMFLDNNTPNDSNASVLVYKKKKNS